MDGTQQPQKKSASRRICTIEIAKEYLSFSAAHFTIFSANRRENLHGHNFTVQSRASALLGDNGLIFDYALLKSEIKSLCDKLDEKLLLPSQSPHLDIQCTCDGVAVTFADETMTYLNRDILTIPVANISVEELSNWFLEKLLANEEIASITIEELEIRVSSGPGQWGISRWPS